VRRIAKHAVVLDQGRVVHEGDARVLLSDPERVRRFLGVAGAE
jgi:branched-chain amino acid transport system ATP-binding protein